MVIETMTYLKQLWFNPFRSIVSGGAILIASATAFSVSASSLSLPDISPEQIAADTERRYETATGTVEIIAPSFDPFENDTSLAGTVKLRSISSSVALDGRTVTGGALLDLDLIYTNHSPDPYDNKGFEEGIFLSGDAASVIRYDNRILDCSENVREVIYDDGYYRGAPYGYVAGVYRLLPRYRGHSGFGHVSYYRPRGYSHYRPRHPRRGAGHYRPHRPNGHGGNGRPYRPDGDRRKKKTRDYVVDTRSDDWVREHRNRDRNRAQRPRRPRGNVVDTDRRGTPNAGRPAGGRPNVNTRPRGGERPQTSRPRRPQTAGAQPRPQSRPHTRPKKGPDRPNVNTNKRPDRPPQSRPSKPRRSSIDRAVDRHFKKSRSVRRKADRQLNFFPAVFPIARIGGYSHKDVSVTYRCAREESLTLHIPQDRLDAARFDGFTLLVLDKTDREIPVYIPPNYVEGFRQAVRASGNSISYNPPIDGSGPVELYEGQPSLSDNAQPRIYGDLPGGVTIKDTENNQIANPSLAGEYPQP